MQHTMTFDLFCFKLEKEYSLIPCEGYRAGRHLKNIRLPGKESLDKHYLYLASWETYSQNPGIYAGCAVLLFQMPDGVPLPGGNMVAVCGTAGLEELANQASMIFAEFAEWHEKLHEADEGNLPPGEMFDSLAGYMQMEIGITNQKNEFDYVTIQEEDNDPMGIYDRPPDEMMAFFNTHREFPGSFRSREVELYPDVYNGLLYYYNFFLEGEYLARLLGIFPDGTFASGQRRLFQYVSRYAERLYILHYKDRQRRRKDSRFLFVLKNLLQAREIQMPVLENVLDAYGWKQEHTFQVLKFSQSNLINNPDSLDFLCSSIEGQFLSCCALRIEEAIFCIRNISLEKDPQDFFPKLSVFLRENLCNAGISNRCGNILRLPMLAEEAGDALDYGLQKQPTHWSFHFSDYILDYLKDTMTAKYDPEELEHPAISLLRKHDQEHHTCLTETLGVFTAHNFRASAAANAMYIHRSTFLHRLRRVEEITGLDFENDKDREWLILSFFISPPESDFKFKG